MYSIDSDCSNYPPRTSQVNWERVAQIQLLCLSGKYKWITVTSFLFHICGNHRYETRGTVSREWDKWYLEWVQKIWKPLFFVACLYTTDCCYANIISKVLLIWIQKLWRACRLLCMWMCMCKYALWYIVFVVKLRSALALRNKNMNVQMDWMFTLCTIPLSVSCQCFFSHDRPCRVEEWRPLCKCLQH